MSVSVEYHYDPASRELQFLATVGRDAYETTRSDVPPEQVEPLAAGLVRAAAKGQSSEFTPTA